MKRSWIVVVVAVCLAFGLRALLLIDATALWSDELYSVGKSFQPSFSSLLAMLREDTHPPAYYSLLWFWGNLVGQNPISLRLLSWLAYLAGGLVMVFQAMALGPVVSRVKVGAVAALLAFCSPYPIRFAIEGRAMPCSAGGSPGGGAVPAFISRRDGRAVNGPISMACFGAGGCGLGWLATPLEPCFCCPDRSPPGLGLMACRGPPVQLKGWQLDWCLDYARLRRP